MDKDRPNTGHRPDREQNKAPGPTDRFYDQALQDEETLRRWELEQSHEPGTDTERAVKLAAMRTEMLIRSRQVNRDTE